MQIYCGLCGEKSHQLFGHLREVHEMGPDRYGERCPGALLISEDLAADMREQRILSTEKSHARMACRNSHGTPTRARAIRLQLAEAARRLGLEAAEFARSGRMLLRLMESPVLRQALQRPAQSCAGQA